MIQSVAVSNVESGSLRAVPFYCHRQCVLRWSETTLVIRNLPNHIETQEQAISWLEELGYGALAFSMRFKKRMRKEL